MPASPMNFVPVRAPSKATRGRRLVAQEYVTKGNIERAIEQIFARPDVDYIHVNSTTAGCYTFRIERQDRPLTENSET